MASSVYQGDDWGLEGTPKWWWKYVLPNPEIFYGQLLSQVARTAHPDPVPWLQHATGEAMEGLAMFHAAVRVGDRDGAARLKKEAVARLARAVNALGSEGGFVGVDQNGPIGPRTHLGDAETRSAG